jgi:hypothetical protein
VRRVPRRPIFALAFMAAGACSSGGASSPPTLREVAAPLDTSPSLGAVAEPSPARVEQVAAPAADFDRLGPCFVRLVGLAGECMATAACAALGGHMSTPGYCPGPPTVECCTAEPVADEHPRPPPGWTPVPQGRVTPEMTAWALTIVTSPAAYPMGARAREHFGPVEVMARVEWHPPDLGHGVVHRGVTLYQPA